MITNHIKPICKYCGKRDDAENMHQDKYTKEFYHDRCRPSFNLRREGGEQDAKR